MILVQALPARDGDCLWVEWDHDGLRRRMLIDGGRADRGAVPAGLAERLNRQPRSERTFDLVVCTHLDLDHIGGMDPLLRHPPAGFGAADVWFNGRHHLFGEDRGPRQGDELSGLLANRPDRWNAGFGGGPVVVPRHGQLPAVALPGLRLTLLSPTFDGLARLAAVWPAVTPRVVRGGADRTQVRDAQTPLAALAGGAYARDPSAANGSSIAFIAEHRDGSRVLFGADAHAEVLLSGIRRLRPPGPYRIDLCKVPHHGSRHNTSPELLQALDCRHWLFSTNGDHHRHPDRQTVARILARPGPHHLWFNYRSMTTS